MNKRPFYTLLAFSVLMMTSLMCDFPDSRESDQLLESQNMTSIAREATRFSQDLTATAQAQITPSATDSPTAIPTDTPLPPEPTTLPDLEIGSPDFTNLPPALISYTDPSGDVTNCESGAVVDDPAADIVSVEIFESRVLEIPDEGFLARVGLAVPANETFLIDWSAALLAAMAPQGSSVYTYTINEIHANVTTVGVLDPDGAGILSGTDTRSFIDELGFVWFLLGQDPGFLQISSFHLPSEDLPLEEKHCGIAPNDSVYVLELP